MHLSGIIKYCLYSDRKELDLDTFPLNMACGMSWEDWSVGLYPYVMWQPGPESLDSVICTCDGLSAMDIEGEGREVVIEEWKATWKSMHTHNNILAETVWMWQLAGMLKIHGLRFARLHVLWVNGNYRPPQPKYMTYLIEFSQAELDKFWESVILKNRDKAIPEEGT